MMIPPSGLVPGKLYVLRYHYLSPLKGMLMLNNKSLWSSWQRDAKFLTYVPAGEIVFFVESVFDKELFCSKVIYRDLIGWLINAGFAAYV